MITPIFSITQDENYLFISIRAPNARITETEIHIDDEDFRFYSKPYYLRLTLPSKITENGEELANYDSKDGNFSVKVSKLIPGQHFEGLDLLTKLLSNNSNKQMNKKPLIEVIEDNCHQNNDLFESIDEDFDWLLEQTVGQESEDLLLLGEKYGFANQYSGVVARIEEEFYGLIDIKDPEHKSLSKRREERLERERNDFNDEHYLSDMFDQKDIISQLIAFNLFGNESQKDQTFSAEMRFKMKELPKKEFILDKSEKKFVLFSMIDILYAFSYDLRVNECEPNVESGWNVCKLSATLSWFETYSSLKDVVITCIRRSLCYPLYRDWNLSISVLKDVIKVLRFGQNYVLKYFLDIHKMLNESGGEGRYLLNDLYITDYCVWLQYLSPNVFNSLANALQNLKISKSDIVLDLDVIEMAAKLAIEESVNENKTVLSESLESIHSSELLHKTSTECSSPTTESSFSSAKFSHSNHMSNDKHIDSDDDIVGTGCDHKRDSDDDSSVCN